MLSIVCTQVNSILTSIFGFKYVTAVESQFLRQMENADKVLEQATRFISYRVVVGCKICMSSSKRISNLYHPQHRYSMKKSSIILKGSEDIYL